MSSKSANVFKLLVSDGTCTVCVLFMQWFRRLPTYLFAVAGRETDVKSGAVETPFETFLKLSNVCIKRCMSKWRHN